MSSEELAGPSEGFGYPELSMGTLLPRRPTPTVRRRKSLPNLSRGFPGNTQVELKPHFLQRTARQRSLETIRVPVTGDHKPLNMGYDEHGIHTCCHWQKVIIDVDPMASLPDPPWCDMDPSISLSDLPWRYMDLRASLFDPVTAQPTQNLGKEDKKDKRGAYAPAKKIHRQGVT